MRFFLFIAVMLLCLANTCASKKENNCMEAHVQGFATQYEGKGLVSVFQFTSNEEEFTVFDHGLAFDAPAIVLNSDCDTVYTYGGMLEVPDKAVPPFDFKDMQSKTQLWPKE